MAADLTCYYDEACTDKLDFQTSAFFLTLGPEAGLDGDGGEVYSQDVYIKNTGDKPALGTIMYKIGDKNNYVFTTAPGQKITTGIANVGDFAVNEVKKITYTTSIPRYTKLATVTISLRFDYYTQP